MALVTGKPVDESGHTLFEEAQKHLVTLCEIGKAKVAHIDATTLGGTRKNGRLKEASGQEGRILSPSDLFLYSKLWDILDVSIAHTGFSSVHLGKELGLSKAQTYRKIKALTGMSPNEIIREIRLRRSLNALKKNNKTVAEIAYELGFNSPTYFTRVFRKRYEILPSEFAKLSKHQ